MLKLIKGLWLLGVLLLLLLLKLLLMLRHLSVMHATREPRRIWILKLIIWIWIRHHWLVRSKRTRNKNLWPCITFYCVGLIYCIFSFNFFLEIWCLFNFNFDILAILFFWRFNLVSSVILTFSLMGKTWLSNEFKSSIVNIRLPLLKNCGYFLSCYFYQNEKSQYSYPFHYQNCLAQHHHYLHHHHHHYFHH